MAAEYEACALKCVLKYIRQEALLSVVVFIVALENPIKMSVDIFSNLISKKDKKLYVEFVKLNSQLYDENFGYRFLTRMRNYVMHRNMPFKKITNSIYIIRVVKILPFYKIKLQHYKQLTTHKVKS